MPRFERPPQVNQSKQALSNLLRQRNPINQFMSTGQTGVGVQPGPQTGPAGYQQTMQRQFPRQPLRQQMPTAMPNNQVGVITFIRLLILFCLPRLCSSNRTATCSPA